MLHEKHGVGREADALFPDKREQHTSVPSNSWVPLPSRQDNRSPHSSSSPSFNATPSGLRVVSSALPLLLPYLGLAKVRAAKVVIERATAAP
jgi:hypothetical protein